ncbi:unnamed protein product [marine sediment metagenome]|uniref:Uncharacterized protein n=1 Tax=marine sediment metagenome TaxID=412755 RepID=X0UMH8_9ZZZZ
MATQQKKKKKLVQRLCRADTLAVREAAGWKKIKPVTIDQKKMTAKGDLILMEKNV